MPPLTHYQHCTCSTEEEVEALLGTVDYPGFQSQKEVRPEFKARSGFRIPDSCIPPKLVRLCFRQLCLRRWASCKAFPVVVGTQTWKKYYFCRSELEFRMESGRPQDFICKAISGHTGMIDQLAYVSPHEYRFDEGARSVVCTVSSDCTVRAWDLQEGSEIWSSAVQPAPLVNVVAYPQLQLVVTVDIQGLIMGWKAKTGSEWAFFSLPASCSSMEACDHPEGPFLLVACDEGTLYTMTVPQLQVVSRVPTFPHSSVSLTCSPDTQWVFVSAQGSDLGPKVSASEPSSW